MSDLEHTDIFVSGGGVAGLTSRGGLRGLRAFPSICGDPAPPITEAAAEGSDLRTTAFLQPSRDFLDRAGLWERLSPHAMPLQIMRIVDAGGERAGPGSRGFAHDFNAADISELPFGWNLPNWLLRREMVAHLATMPNARFPPGTGTAPVLTREARHA